MGECCSFKEYMQEVIYKLPTPGSTLNSYIFKWFASIFTNKKSFI